MIAIRSAIWRPIRLVQLQKRGRQLRWPQIRGQDVSNADEFREKAEECRQQAEKAISPRDKAVWLRIAESWLKMAQEADQRPPKRKQ